VVSPVVSPKERAIRGPTYPNNLMRFDAESYWQVVPPVFRKDHVRPAGEEDAPVLARLHDATEAHPWRKRIAGGGWFIADDDDTLVGYMHLEVENGVGHLREFVVLQPDRRVGDALVRKAVSFARRLGCVSVEVRSDLTDPDTYPVSDRYYNQADGRFWTKRHFVRKEAEEIAEGTAVDSWAVLHRFVRSIEPMSTFGSRSRRVVIESETRTRMGGLSRVRRK
jgi:GNAT superfamily N-acetyltransferase